MLNIAILVVTVLVLFSSLKQFGKILSVGSAEKLVELWKQINEIKERCK